MRRCPEPATAGHVTCSWARSFRALYFFRVGFSIAWVALVSTLAWSATPGDTPGVLAGILLVCYPVSDAVATVFDLRANRRALSRWLQQINLMAGVAGAGGILIALSASLSAAITVFGIWAVASGIIMAVLALRRRRVLGGQWLMIIGESRLRLRRNHVHRLDRHSGDRARRPRPILGRRCPLVSPGRVLAAALRPAITRRRGRRCRKTTVRDRA